MLLLSIYAFSISFQRLFYTSWTYYKLQVPEVVFLLILVYFLFKARYFRVRLSTLWPIILFVFWTAITAFYHWKRDSWLELLGLIYLMTLTGLVSSFTALNEDGIKQVLRYFIYGVSVNCILGFIGYLLNIGGINTAFGFVYDHYPIVGNVYRIQGLTSHPIMLGNLIICSLFLSKFLLPMERKSIVIILILGLLLTFSKAILLALSSVLIGGILFKKIQYKFLAGAISIVLIFIQLAFTHFNLLDDSNAPDSRYWNKERINLAGNIDVSTTSYYFLKKACLKMGIEHPIFGVGGGNSNAAIKTAFLSNKNSDLDPHSLYFGTFAEYGLLGLFLFFVIIFTIYKLIRNMDVKWNKYQQAFALIFLFFLLEGISSDIINYRQIWLFIGFIVLLSSGMQVSQSRLSNAIYL